MAVVQAHAQDKLVKALINYRSTVVHDPENMNGMRMRREGAVVSADHVLDKHGGFIRARVIVGKGLNLEETVAKADLPQYHLLPDGDTVKIEYIRSSLS
ncbi:hypothetical protein HYV81_05050 [Candidatus Woesearchaeota archaeon]|nr:hypothetical protein [Candidatus Woesearchaeota archaeon]